MEKLRIREVLHHSVYILDQDMAWYLKRTASEESVKASVLRYATEARVRILAPFAPYLSEEIWELFGNKPFVATAKWPKADEKWIDAKAEEAEDLVKNVLADVQSILKVTKIAPKKIILYASSKWKWDAYLTAIQLAEKNELNVGALIKTLLKDESLKKKAKEVSSFAQTLATEISTMPSDMRSRRQSMGTLDEVTVLRDAKQFYEEELACQVEIYSEGDPKIYDPKQRVSRAKPYRPAIFIE